MVDRSSEILGDYSQAEGNPALGGGRESLASGDALSGTREILVDRSLGLLRIRVQDAISTLRIRPVDPAEVIATDPDAVGRAAILMVRGTADARAIADALVANVRAQAPFSAIYAVGHRGDRLLPRFPLLARAGADLAFELDLENHSPELSEWVQSRLDAPIPRVMPAALVNSDDRRRSARIATWCLRNGNAHHSVAELAARFGCDRKTIYRECYGTFAMSASELLAMGRYLHAEEMHKRFSYLQAALRLGYSTPSAVANILKTGRARWPELVKRAPTSDCVQGMAPVVRD